MDQMILQLLLPMMMKQNLKLFRLQLLYFFCNLQGDIGPWDHLILFWRDFWQGMTEIVTRWSCAGVNLRVRARLSLAV